MFFQVDMMIDPVARFGSSLMGVQNDVGVTGVEFEEVQCGIDGTYEPAANFYCWNRLNRVEVDGSWIAQYSAPMPALAGVGVWHTLRMEIEPATWMITYYVDGRMVGSHIPANADDVRDDWFRFVVGICTDATNPMTGYFDNVWIGLFNP
jgi:hypothetical protein